MRILFLTLLLIFSFGHLSGQSKLKGRVIDASSGEPLPFATIYFNSTTNGATSDEKGQFEISVNPAYLELIISFIGYKTINYKVDINSLKHTFKFEMMQENNELEEVEVSSERGEQWYRNLEDFTRNFIGSSSTAIGAKITNPKVLQFSFDPESMLFEAKAKAPLIIENKSLGYRIDYTLVDYMHNYQSKKMSYLGYSKFTEMDGGKSKKKKWAKNRKKAYLGSSQHFLKTLSNQTVKEEGFIIHELKRIPNPNLPNEEEIKKAKEELIALHGNRDKLKLSESSRSILRRSKAPKLVDVLNPNELGYRSFVKMEDDFNSKISFEDYWQVRYNNEQEDEHYIPPGKISPSRNEFQISIITMTVKEAVFNKYGVLKKPLALIFEQYWAFEKVGDMLPLDYQSEKQ